MAQMLSKAKAQDTTLVTSESNERGGGSAMLGWALAFLVAAVLVALLGLTQTATLAAMAKVLFWIFLAGLVVSLVMHFNRREA
jgi:uncharacterized membrane protein YtjA (UPF0391 family)